jgi:hypothetical protein
MLKHQRRHAWARTALLVGLAAAAIVSKLTAHDVRRYVRLKTM